MFIANEIPKYVMLQESFGVRLHSSFSPERFFPWSQRASEIKRECRESPHHRCEMHEQQTRPSEDQQASKDHEGHICSVKSNNEPREKSVNHFGTPHTVPSLSFSIGTSPASCAMESD